MDLPKTVVVMAFGEPKEHNVIGYDEQTNQLQLQEEGYYGSFYTPVDRVMKQYEVDWHFIAKAAAEIDRLQIKQTILENRERRQF
jgi:hypothetical protein